MSRINADWVIGTNQFPFSLVPPKIVVPLPGLGITYLSLSTSVVALSASPFTSTVCPLMGYILRSCTRVFAPRPVAFTKILVSSANSTAACNAPASPTSVGRRALSSLPPAERKRRRRYERWCGTLMQIAEKWTADCVPGRR